MNERQLTNTMEFESSANAMFCCGCGRTVCSIEGNLTDLLEAARNHSCVEETDE
jgi:hypothetical protein